MRVHRNLFNLGRKIQRGIGTHATNREVFNADFFQRGLDSRNGSVFQSAAATVDNQHLADIFFFECLTQFLMFITTEKNTGGIAVIKVQHKDTYNEISLKNLTQNFRAQKEHFVQNNIKLALVLSVIRMHPDHFPLFQKAD